MTLLPGVHEVTTEEAERARQEALRLGASVFVLSTEGTSSKADFFACVRASLPLDPPVVSARSWDGLEDSLWEGLHSVDPKLVVVIWKGASDLRGRSPEVFATALDIFADLASSLGRPEHTVGKPKTLSVYVS